MNTYFKLNYEFDKNRVHEAIAERLELPGSDYICVADGVIANTALRHKGYLQVVNGGMFSICDSSYVPLYIRLLYGIRYEQYCGSQIFEDIIRSRKYRMFFMGAQQKVLDGLRSHLMEMNPDVADMQFYELPFKGVEEFDYEGIAKMVEADGADIIWVALGAPKQEVFMSKLKPHLNHGVMIAVGAAFKFFSGVDVRRAPQWMVKHHFEFLHRLMLEPKKQAKRCALIIATLPFMMVGELRKRILSLFTRRRKEDPKTDID